MLSLETPTTPSVVPSGLAPNPIKPGVKTPVYSRKSLRGKWKNLNFARVFSLGLALIGQRPGTIANPAPQPCRGGTFPRPHLLLFAGGLALAGLLAGCATTPTGPERVTGKEDPLQAPATESIGLVILVDPVEEVALVEVHSARTRIAAVLITRNEALVETARLEPTRFQRGRTLGARIVSGLPNVGDEVVVDR